MELGKEAFMEELLKTNFKIRYNLPNKIKKKAFLILGLRTGICVQGTWHRDVANRVPFTKELKNFLHRVLIAFTYRAFFCFHICFYLFIYLFIYVFIYCCSGCGYIATFTKLYTMYQIYHT
jgi:hypothetical protein